MKDGKIVVVGCDDDICLLVGFVMCMVDFVGWLMLFGFIDGYVYLFEGYQIFGDFDLFGINDLDMIV